jgi:hypothetical protein
MTAVLCFDRVFKLSNQATNLSGQLATTNLPPFLNYIRLLKVPLHLDPSKDAAVQKLLCIRLLSETWSSLVETRSSRALHLAEESSKSDTTPGY